MKDFFSHTYRLFFLVLYYQIKSNQSIKMSSIVNHEFVPELLVNGDNSQLEKWIWGKGNSVYVKWVPNEMSEEDVYNYFGILGTIKRVEFVPHQTGNSRMLFVHFETWFNDNWTSVDIRRRIATAYPKEHSLPITFCQYTGGDSSQKIYYLKCCVNIRPIPTVDYNTHQLSDMFERLNTRVTQQLEGMREEIGALKAEIVRLNSVIREKESDEEDDTMAAVYPEYEEDAREEEYKEYDDYVSNRINSSILKHTQSVRHFV